MIRPTLLPLAFLLLAAPARAQSSAAVEGSDQTRMVAPVGAPLTDYSNAGYRMTVKGDEVVVEVDASPLASTAAFTSPAREAEEEPVERLARGVTAGAPTRYEATARVLGWVARNIDYVLDRSLDQDATAVLARRSGYCTGVARLTVAMLQAVDIPAREVAGYVLGGGPPATTSGYHRWIESYYPDRGWVFSDPLSFHHYVPATYLRLAGERLTASHENTGILVARTDLLRPIDLYPWAVPGIMARRNEDRQLAAALRVEVSQERAGMVVLEGKTTRRIHALLDGATSFLGLDPGSYTLRLMVPGRDMVLRSIEIRGRVRTALYLSAGPLLAPPQRPGQESPSKTEE